MFRAFILGTLPAAFVLAAIGATGCSSADGKTTDRPGSAAAIAASPVESDSVRIKSLLDQRVVSQSEFDQRRTQMEAAHQQLEAAKNSAAQQFQSLQAARARITLARKALADTVVRAPFAGLVAERT